MKFAKQILFSALLFASVSLPAAAQNANGKFTITHESRWGTAVLPAGTYTVALRNDSVPLVIITSENRNPISIIAVAQYLDTATCHTSSLELEQNGASWDVRSLCFAASVAIHFGKVETINQTATLARATSTAGAN
jgi:hypothetical protein